MKNETRKKLSLSRLKIQNLSNATGAEAGAWACNSCRSFLCGITDGCSLDQNSCDCGDSVFICSPTKAVSCDDTPSA